MNDRMVAGVRWSIDWLHRRADTMDDPHARHVLHSAATGLGWKLSKIRQDTPTPGKEHGDE